MYEIVTIILVMGGAFAVVGGIAFILQRNAQNHGNLFTQPARPAMRIFAFVLGLFFAGAFVVEILSTERFHIVLPFLTLLLFVYSIGFNRFLEEIQKNKK